MPWNKLKCSTKTNELLCIMRNKIMLSQLQTVVFNMNIFYTTAFSWNCLLFQNVKLLQQFISPHTGMVYDPTRTGKKSSHTKYWNTTWRVVFDVVCGVLLSTGVCMKQQKKLNEAINTAQNHGTTQNNTKSNIRQYTCRPVTTLLDMPWYLVLLEKRIWKIFQFKIFWDLWNHWGNRSGWLLSSWYYELCREHLKKMLKFRTINIFDFSIVTWLFEGM